MVYDKLYTCMTVRILIHWNLKFIHLLQLNVLVYYKVQYVVPCCKF